jgi:hypothetical protein
MSTVAMASSGKCNTVINFQNNIDNLLLKCINGFYVCRLTFAWGGMPFASAKVAPGRCAWWGGQAQPDRLFQESLRTKKTAGHAGGWGNVLP